MRIWQSWLGAGLVSLALTSPTRAGYEVERSHIGKPMNAPHGVGLMSRPQTQPGVGQLSIRPVGPTQQQTFGPNGQQPSTLGVGQANPKGRQACRPFSAPVRTGAEIVMAQGTVCLGADGIWHIKG